MGKNTPLNLASLLLAVLILPSSICFAVLDAVEEDEVPVAAPAAPVQLPIQGPKVKQSFYFELNLPPLNRAQVISSEAERSQRETASEPTTKQKYFQVNIENYRIRSSPVFSDDTSNVIGVASLGKTYPITRTFPVTHGTVTGILVDGKERWVYAPNKYKSDFTICETAGCTGDVSSMLSDAMLSAKTGPKAKRVDCAAVPTDDFDPSEDSLPPALRRSGASALDNRRLASEQQVIAQTWAEMGRPGCIPDTRNQPRPDFRAIKNGKDREKAFVMYMLPFALEIQKNVGLPAGLVIAQAAIETGYGTSNVFNRTQNIFGHSCFSYGKVTRYNIAISGQNKEIKGTCELPRPSNEGGWYMKFANPQESVYAYAALLMNPKSRAYKGVNRLVASARPSSPDLGSAIEAIHRSGYADDSGYGPKLSGIARKYNLAQYKDKVLCPPGWDPKKVPSAQSAPVPVNRQPSNELQTTTSADTRPRPAPVAPVPVKAPLPPVRPSFPAVNAAVSEEPNCAEKIILSAAKKNVANEWGNSSSSSGMCALGVRQSLQASGVGSIKGGLGNAVDQVSALKQHGYVDSGLRDISKAPPGAVLIFRGPNTDSYFRTGHMGRPRGDWVGHVTIKGDDGFYYTDGRTRQPAIGWSGTKNVSNVRNLMAIMVPGPSLVAAYADRCTAKR